MIFDEIDEVQRFVTKTRILLGQLFSFKTFLFGLVQP